MQNGDKQILHDITFAVPQGTICALVGRSGSGKSTVLRCLNRLSEPPPQTIFLENADITTLNVLQLRRQVGLVLQTPVMFAGTVRDNVRYPASLRGETLSDVEVGELLGQVGLEKAVWEQSAETYSSPASRQVASLLRSAAATQHCADTIQPKQMRCPTFWVGMWGRESIFQSALHYFSWQRGGYRCACPACAAANRLNC